MNYQERMRMEQQIAFDIGMKIGFQQAMDYMCMALNDPDCMGAKGVLGGEKINRIAIHAVGLQKIYRKAFTPKDPEADLWQERLDAAQRKIFKDKAQSFYVRYPDVRRCDYGEKRR